MTAVLFHRVSTADIIHRVSMTAVVFLKVSTADRMHRVSMTAVKISELIKLEKDAMKINSAILSLQKIVNNAINTLKWRGCLCA